MFHSGFGYSALPGTLAAWRCMAIMNGSVTRQRDAAEAYLDALVTRMPSVNSAGRGAIS